MALRVLSLKLEHNKRNKIENSKMVIQDREMREYWRGKEKKY
jgi:hypothetical protein